MLIGSKMGKSANGAVWLNENELSNWDFWQYWRNTEDLDVIKFLKLFTELPMEEINRFEQLKGAEINQLHNLLSFNLVLDKNKCKTLKAAHPRTPACTPRRTPARPRRFQFLQLFSSTIPVYLEYFSKLAVWARFGPDLAKVWPRFGPNYVHLTHFVTGVGSSNLIYALTVVITFRNLL